MYMNERMLQEEGTAAELAAVNEQSCNECPFPLPFPSLSTLPASRFALPSAAALFSDERQGIREREQIALQTGFALQPPPALACVRCCCCCRRPSA